VDDDVLAPGSPITPIDMMNEVIALRPSNSVAVLWSRRWVLVLAIVSAAALAFGIASFVRQTWESQVVVQIGQIEDKLIERPEVVARRVNLGTLLCGGADGYSDALRAVTASFDGAPDLGEVRLSARGLTADQARARAAAAGDCLVKRHQPLFDTARERTSDYRHALKIQLDQAEEHIQITTSLLARVALTPANVAEVLLLQSTLNSDRTQHLELARELREIDVRHQNDGPTTILQTASMPAAPLWPRRGLIAFFAGAVAFAFASGVLVFMSTGSIGAPQRT